MFLNFIRHLLLCGVNNNIISDYSIIPFAFQIEVNLAIILLIIGCLVLLLKRPLGINKNIKISAWIILITILCVYLFLNLNFHSFRAADAEWGSIYRAKTILDGNRRVYLEDNSGIVYPLLIAGILKISNLYIPTIRIFNIILGTLIILLIFECSYILFGNILVSFFNVFIYILTPWTYYYTGILFGLPTVVHFFTLLSLLFVLLAFKYHKLYFHIFAILSLFILNQTKLEYFLYYLIYLLIFILTKEYKLFKKKHLIFFIIIVLVCFIISLIKFGLFKISFLSNPNWCGFPSQAVDIIRPTNTFIKTIDDILYYIINPRIKLSYFLTDISVFIKFWTQITLILPVLLSVLGFGLACKEFTNKKILILIPVIWFLILAIGYLFDCGWYEARHAISAFGLLIIYSGYYLWWLLKNSYVIKRGKVLFYSILFFIFVTQFLLCFWNLQQINSEIQAFPYKYQLYYLLQNLMNNISSQKSFFIVVDNDSKYILKLLGYQTTSFNDYLNNNDKIINYEQTINYFFTEDINKFNNDNIYFIKSPTCYYFSAFQRFCDEANKRAKAIIKTISWRGNNFTTVQNYNNYNNDKNNTIQLLLLKYVQ
ncbi:MAG: hypothetical protein QXD43_01030 [Candidatus Aenigmatarchaeota archaeon]